MAWKVFRVHLNDEIPRVGSGERLVEADVGRKWVRVRRHSRFADTAHSSRLGVNAWEALKPVPVDVLLEVPNGSQS